MRTRRFLVLLLLMVGAAPAAALVDVGVSPQSTTTSVGQVFEVQIQLVSDGTGITADGFLNFDASKLEVQSVTPSTTLLRTLLNRYDNVSGTVDCAAGTAFGGTPPSGTFALCTIRFGAKAAGAAVLHFSSTLPRKTEVAGAGGVSVLGTVTDGSVTITAAAATATPTNTSPPAATPTPAPAPSCCGDCNSDGLVTTAEYNLCRDISIGSADISACPACSCTGSGQVQSTDLVQVLNNSASGCPQPTPVSGAPWAINPRDRGAVAFNSLDCRGTAGKPCLRIPVLAGTPTAQQTGDFWCEDVGSTHRCCYATGPTTRYCFTGS